VKFDGGHKILLAIVFFMALLLIASSLRIERLNTPNSEVISPVSDSLSDGGYCCMERLW